MLEDPTLALAPAPPRMKSRGDADRNGPKSWRTVRGLPGICSKDLGDGRPAWGPHGTDREHRKGVLWRPPRLKSGLHGWVSVLFQPAKNGLPSGHPILLWGPPNLCPPASGAANSPTSSGVGQSERRVPQPCGSGLSKCVTLSDTCS